MEDLVAEFSIPPHLAKFALPTGLASSLPHVDGFSGFDVLGAVKFIDEHHGKHVWKEDVDVPWEAAVASLADPVRTCFAFALSSGCMTRSPSALQRR